MFKKFFDSYFKIGFIVPFFRIIFFLIFLCSKSNYIRIDSQKMNKTLLLLAIIIQGALASINLILNGGFDHHPPYNSVYTCPTCVYTYQACYITNFIDYNWYDGYGIEMQFRTMNFSSTSSVSVIDTCSRSETKLMQDIALKENGYYRFSFDMCKNERETCNYLSSWIGTQQMYNMEQICIDECVTYQKYFRWHKDENLSVLFIGYNYNYLTNACVYGPLLDNVSLVQFQQVNRSLTFLLKPTKKITPRLQIATNLTLNDVEPDKLEKISKQFQQISINAIVYVEYELISSNQNKLCIILTLKKDIQIANLSVLINSFIINDTLYNFFSGQTIIEQPLTFLFDNQLKIVNFLNQMNQPMSFYLRDTVLVSRVLGIGSIFFDIFAFWQLAIFYHYIGIETPNYVKYSIEQSFKNFLIFGVFEEVSLDSYVYPESNFSMKEKIPQTKTQWDQFYELGYTSNYYKSNLQPFTMISIGLIRSIVFQLIFNMIGFKLFRMNRKWHKNLAYDIVSWIPFLVLVPTIILSSSFGNFAEKVNYILHILTLFICIITPCFFLITSFVKLTYRRKKNSKQYKSKKVETVYISLEFIFTLCLTFLTGIKSKDLFLLISSILIIAKITYLIKSRSYFNRCDFFLKLLSGLIWLIYTGNFILFRIVEILAGKGIINIETNGFWQQCFKILGISVLIIFSIGGWFYLLGSVVNLFCEIKEAIWKLKKDCQRKFIRNKVQDVIEPKMQKMNKKKTKFQIGKKQEQKSDNKSLTDIKKQNDLIIEQVPVEQKKPIRIFVMRQHMQQLRLRKLGNIKMLQKMQLQRKPRAAIKDNFWDNIDKSAIPES